jgi:fatty-acyl-CoA synthase
VPKANETVTAEEIIAYSKKKIAGFKVPKKVFVTDALPRSTTGKVLKTVLREKFSAQQTKQSA